MKFQTKDGRLIELKMTYRDCVNCGAGDFFLNYYIPLELRATCLLYQNLLQLTKDAKKKFDDEPTHHATSKMAYRNQHLFFTHIIDALTVADLLKLTNTPDWLASHITPDKII